MKIIDFGVGNYSNDYTGHAFLGAYSYNQKQFLLNTSYEFSNNWQRPAQSQGFSQQSADTYKLTEEQKRQQNWNPYYEPLRSYEQMLNEFSFFDLNNVPVNSWDPMLDNKQTNYNNRLHEEDMKLGFDYWYTNRVINDNKLSQINRQFQQPMYNNPLSLPSVQYIETYRFAKVWWFNETRLNPDSHQQE